MKTFCKYFFTAAALFALPLSIVAQQNIVDGALSPTSTAPAFGAVIDYGVYPQISDLPTIYLTTDKVETLDYSEKTDTYYSATIVIVDKHGKMKQRNEAVTFRGRGNSTWYSYSYKKPWRLKFPSKTSLLAEWDLNKGEEVENYADAKSWTLLANHFDKSMIRNALTNELGKLVGMPFCPAYRFVDLVLNGEYFGTYQVSDHVQVDKKRVYVGSKNDWFMELCDGNSYGEDPQFETGGCHFNIKDPDNDKKAAAAMLTYMEKAIAAVNNYAGNLNMSDYIDLASLADYIMGMDVTANYDAVKGNGYCYMGLESTDKLKWGPLWDIDLGYGNLGGWATVENAEEKHFWVVNSGYNAWFYKKIYESAEFQKVFYPRWKRVYEAGLAASLNNKVEELYNLVKNSAILNYTKGGHVVSEYDYEYWSMGVSNMGLTYTDSHDATVVTTDYATACSDIKTFITTHVEWLNDQYISDYESITGLSASDAVKPTIVLEDKAAEGVNTGLISTNCAVNYDVQLNNRTLYRDGYWNTICLPFNLTISGSVLDGAKVMELSDASISGGTLTLGFKAVDAIEAGVPYLIKWDKSTSDIVSPTFRNAILKRTMNPTEITGVITFTGNYDPVKFTGADNTKLYLGEKNTLYYPNGEMTIGACRAYFQLADGITADDPKTKIKAVVLNFDESESTAISTIHDDAPASTGWFTLDGRRLNQEPVSGGLYIRDGKKVMIK